VAKLGFCGASYSSQSVNADCQATINWYPERVESQDMLLMYPTPGKRIAYNLAPIGPIRGKYTLNGRTFAVSGNNFWELFANGSKTLRGSVASDVISYLLRVGRLKS
jgi:hypothetical protein